MGQVSQVHKKFVINLSKQQTEHILISRLNDIKFMLIS